MTATRPTASATLLSQWIAAEIRAEMARQNMTQREFARRLGQIDMWLSRRLKAIQPLNVDELDHFAEILGLNAMELLRRAEESRGRPSALQVGYHRARPAAGRRPRRPRRLLPEPALAAA